MISFRTPPATPATTSHASPTKSPPRMSLILAKLRQPNEHTTLSSGQPQTHPALAEEGATCSAKAPVEHRDQFICTGAVDVAKLLRGSRSSLVEKAAILGANALVDEQWTCTIRRSQSKPRQHDVFRVHIRYCASATRSTRPDPNKPVALEKVRSHSGFMTILQRE